MDKKALAAECLTMVTGLYPEKPVRVMDADEAIGIPKAAERAVSAFMDLESPEKALKTEQISYLATWRKLNEKQNDRELVGVLDDPEVGAAYLQKLSECRDYLKGQWRPTKITHLTGPEILPPGRSEEDRCRDLYAMVNDGRRMLGRLASGCMLAEEIAAMRACYPTFAEVLADMIRAEIGRRSIRRKSYRVPFWQDVAISLFLGEPIGSDVETVNAETQPPETKAPPEFDIATDKKRTQAMTTADRVQDGSASG